MQWYRAGYGIKTFPIPYSLYQTLLIERIDADRAQANFAHNYCFRQQISMSGRNQVSFSITIPDGYDYLIQGFRAGQPADAPGTLAPVLRFRAFWVPNERNYNDVPLPLNLITTPTRFQPIRYRLEIPHMATAGSTFLIDITGGNGARPTAIEILTEGVFFPKQVRSI